ncbi:MAG TPA: hypothetical protein VLX28_00330 [Thermoanaerobaculia bacterium]|nr:hypothetical protein [Thermoanaerobaculia bacterium]
MNLWVIDSSPLIFLAKLSRLDLLQKGAEEILAPPAVLAEIAEHALKPSLPLFVISREEEMAIILGSESDSL